MSTSIEWTRNADGTQGKTWNPTLGCSKVSPGCDGCYAISVAHRAMTPTHKGLTVLTDEGTDWTGEVRCLPERLDIPLKRRKPTTWFVDSMSDLFHPDVPSDFIAEVFAVMALADQHTFQVLTKRPQRMAKLLANDAWQDDADTARLRRASLSYQFCDWPRPNIWAGTSIESDRYVWRADHLRHTPAAVRWLSLEPLLGPLPSLDLTGIDWVVAGGESGPKARPCNPWWVRDTRDRCIEAGIPFLWKQWGAWIPYEPDPQLPFWVSQHGDIIDGHYLPPDLSEHQPTSGWWWPNIDEDPVYRRVGKGEAGRELDGQVWDQIPAGVDCG